MWGTNEYLRQLFGGEVARMQAMPKMFNFRYASAAHMLQVFRDFYGPIHKAFGAVGPDGEAALEADLLDLMSRFNTAGSSSLVIPAAYLEVVLTKRSG